MVIIIIIILLCADVPTCHTTEVREVTHLPSAVHSNMKNEEPSRDVDSCYSFIDTPQRSLTLTPIVVQPMKEEEGHHCTVCNEIFDSTSCLIDHVREIHNKKTDLDNEQEQEVAVNGAVTNETYVNTSVTMKTGTKHCIQSYACGVCKERFNSKYDLKIHTYCHRDTNTSMFTCNLCSYQCKQRSHLISHICTHTGEKPFSCSLCSHKCTRKRNLSRHMRTHCDEDTDEQNKRSSLNTYSHQQVNVDEYWPRVKIERMCELQINTDCDQIQNHSTLQQIGT